MTKRLFLRLRRHTIPPKVHHYSGYPPELTDGVDTRVELGPAALLVMIENPNGVFLYRYDESGRCVGDTWHISIEDAKHQVVYEYDEPEQHWIDIPPDVTDVIAFVTSERPGS
jgi:hypothetical protein